MSSWQLEVWPFHSACFLTFQDMCVALPAISLWSWDLGSHIFLPGAFTAAAPCREVARDAELGGMSCCSQVYFFIASLPRKPVSHIIQILLDHHSLVKLKCYDSFWMWGMWAALPQLLFSSSWKKSYVIQAFPSSFSSLHSNLLYLQLDCAYVSSWCGAVGADL